jgi:cell division protein FtsQ
VWRLLRSHRRLRLALVAGIVSVPLLIGSWLWLRDSALVVVQRVRVSGLHDPEAGAIEAALSAAARRMSTLHVNLGALRAAVVPFPVVRDVQATASFPHALSIRVIEQPPVAALVVAGTRTAVAADGVVLGPALLSSAVPTIEGGYAPGTGGRVRDGALLNALSVLGAAPAPFVKVAARVYTGPNGLTVAMRNGLLVYFGDATRPHAKWLSLARVLADPSSSGASYLDVRVPERPAAGFPSGTRPASSSTAATGSSEASGQASPGAQEGTIAALAARLAGAAGNELSAGSKEAPAPSGTEPQSPSGASEGGSTKPSETSPAPAGESSSAGATTPTKGP